MIDREALAALERCLAAPDPALDDSLLLLSAAMTGRTDAIAVGRRQLDELASGVVRSTPEGILEHLADCGFCGDADDYHAEENSYLDRVLERRVGMPITLSAIAVEVGRRIDVGLHMIGFPGHVLVGVAEDPESFLDVFAGRMGRRGDVDAVPPELFAPAPVPAMVLRVCANLANTFRDRDVARLGDVYEVQAALPLDEAARRALAFRAEQMARWDVAARILERLDPDDPEITTLWAKLN